MHLEIDYPDVERDLNRWLPLVKWLLAIPHYIVLVVLLVVAIVVVLIAWFAILFTGRYPAGALQLRGGGWPLEPSRTGLRVPSGHRPIPAIQPQLIRPPNG